MAKKGSLPLIYMIGMALVVIGFICPVFDFFIGTLNGFDFINFKDFGTTTIGALLIIIGAVLGLVFCFVGGKNSGMLKLVGLLVSIAGGVVLIISYSGDVFSEGIGKFFIEVATYGFYMILAGWAVGVVGYVMKK
jgi:hypothetical protein